MADLFFAWRSQAEMDNMFFWKHFVGHCGWIIKFISVLYNVKKVDWKYDNICVDLTMKKELNITLHMVSWHPSAQKN